jgi:hypothetical protein
MAQYISLSAPNGFHGTKTILVNPELIGSIEPFDTTVVTVKSYPCTTISMSDGSKKHVFETPEEVLTLAGVMVSRASLKSAEVSGLYAKGSPV